MGNSRRVPVNSPSAVAPTGQAGGESFIDRRLRVENSSDQQGIGTLYVVGVPIGNTEDITLRALRILRNVAVVAVEDTRFGTALLESLGIARDVICYRNRPGVTMGQEILQHLICGGDVALIADAGTPLVADPGSALVRAAIDLGALVVSVPGPVAAISALVVSGLVNGGFSFDGFLPLSEADRSATLKRLAQEKRVIVLYERRRCLKGTLTDLARTLGPDRPISLSIDLTRPGESTIRTTLGQALRNFRDIPRGECTLVIGLAAK